MLPEKIAQAHEVGPARSLDEFAQEGTDFVNKSRQGAHNTQVAYAGDWKRFLIWCQEYSQPPMPAEVSTVASFLIFLSRTKKVVTVQRHLAAISKAHRLAGHPSPTKDDRIKELIDGMELDKGEAPKQASAFTLAHFKRVVQGIDVARPDGIRDRALLLLGFAGAFRRDELVSLNIEDLLIEEDGIIIRLARSKTNQKGKAEEKAVFFAPDRRTCPVRAVKEWLQLLHDHGRTSGPLFVSFYKGQRLGKKKLSAVWFNKLVQRYLGASYSAHSLRASFVTISKLNGADDSKIMNQTKHKTTAMIRRYTRLDNIRQHNAAQDLGL